MTKNIYPFRSKISFEQRKAQFMQEPRLVWFTGLSGSGKTTLALHLEHYLFNHGYKIYLLDGDNLRNGLNKDLGFTKIDRKENMRRVGEVAKIMLDAGLIVLCAFISPYEEERNFVKELIGETRFSEVFLDCPLQVCEQRDTKGLYAKARQGIIPNFTGISDPYEPPKAPALKIDTAVYTIDQSLNQLLSYLEPLLQIQESTKPTVTT
jgi:adenylylsulfate kinase